MEKYKCPDCGGDGIETCHNPDHGFISALDFHEVGRLGCPVCGHHPKHKVAGGAGKCESCNGLGVVDKETAIKIMDGFEMDVDLDDFFIETKII